MTDFFQKDIKEVTELLCERERYIILFHTHPDGDATASAFALKEIIELTGRRAFCVCDSEVPERLSFVSDKRQKSVLYTSLPDDYQPDCIISVDTASASQLGELYDVYEGKIDLMIDHHSNGTYYADHYVHPECSACGEVLYDIILGIARKFGIGELPLSVKELIYTAISADTGCFRYNNTTPRSLEIAAKALSDGVCTSDINHKLFGIKTLKQMQVEHAGFERMNFYADGRIAVITFPYSLKEQYGASDENLETLIDVARSVKGVEVSAVVKQFSPENKFRVSMRSSTDFDVAQICEMYGGGGHTRAAGCTLNCDSILTAEMTIVSVVEMKFAEDELE